MRFATGGGGTGLMRSSGVTLGLSSSALCVLRAAVRVVCFFGVIKFDTNEEYSAFLDTRNVRGSFNKPIKALPQCPLQSWGTSDAHYLDSLFAFLRCCSSLSTKTVHWI